jgi:hypothetical protein
LTVAFTSSTSGVCTITSGGVLAFVAAGTCTINADQVGSGSYSAATTVTRSFTVSAVVPGAPTIGATTASSGQVSVAFTAPASTGGASITSYTVTSSPGGFTASGSSSPIVVTGLTDGTAYTFTVTATNTAGTGSASGASTSTTWVVYSVGGVGPGGGLVFLISGGKTYEMAPKTWNGGASDPAMMWCATLGGVTAPGAGGSALGTGAANTVAIEAVCASGAGYSAGAYAGGGKNDWYLPSVDELDAMYLYKPSIPAGAYTFATGGIRYWTSTSTSGGWAGCQWFDTTTPGVIAGCIMGHSHYVRPIRSW